MWIQSFQYCKSPVSFLHKGLGQGNLSYKLQDQFLMRFGDKHSTGSISVQLPQTNGLQKPGEAQILNPIILRVNAKPGELVPPERIIRIFIPDEYEVYKENLPYRLQLSSNKESVFLSHGALCLAITQAKVLQFLKELPSQELAFAICLIPVNCSKAKFQDVDWATFDAVDELAVIRQEIQRLRQQSEHKSKLGPIGINCSYLMAGGNSFNTWELAQDLGGEEDENHFIFSLNRETLAQYRSQILKELFHQRNVQRSQLGPESWDFKTLHFILKRLGQIRKTSRLIDYITIAAGNSHETFDYSSILAGQKVRIVGAKRRTTDRIGRWTASHSLVTDYVQGQYKIEAIKLDKMSQTLLLKVEGIPVTLPLHLLGLGDWEPGPDGDPELQYNGRRAFTSYAAPTKLVELLLSDFFVKPSESKSPL